MSAIGSASARGPEMWSDTLVHPSVSPVVYPGSADMRDRGAFGWAVRTGRGGDGRAEARLFPPWPGAHRPGGGHAVAGARTGSGLARPDGRAARADRWIRVEALLFNVSDISVTLKRIEELL